MPKRFYIFCLPSTLYNFLIDSKSIFEVIKALLYSLLSDYNRIGFMADSSTQDKDLTDIIQNLKDLRLEFQILYYPKHCSVETEIFHNPKDALDFYTSAYDHQNPVVKCLISASLGNFFYSCVAPITLRSLTDIIDADNEISARVEEKARKALAMRIYNDLPFNSNSHGIII